MLDQLAGQDVTVCNGYPVAAEPQAAYKYAHGSEVARDLAQGCTDASRTTYAHRIGRHVSVLLGARSRHCHCCSLGRSHLFTYFSHFMFTYSATRTSAAVQFVHVDLLRGVATVSFKEGNMYEYKNVSRRAILSLMNNPNMSLGFWVNHNLLDTKRTSYKLVPSYA